jgi:hypothetical protein
MSSCVVKVLKADYSGAFLYPSGKEEFLNYIA